jgi:large subunit ribosomal protein L28
MKGAYIPTKNVGTYAPPTETMSVAHNVTKRRWNANLRRERALANGALKTIMVCTSCFRSGKVSRVC